MRRIIGAILASALMILIIVASDDGAVAQYQRRGQDPIAGHAAMYCSTMYGCAMNDETIVNAPEGFKIVKFDIWSLDTVALRMTLKFFYNYPPVSLLDTTKVDINQYSPAGVSEECQWFWPFTVACDRILMTSGTVAGDADWAACAYIMRYGEGAGVAGAYRVWPLPAE